MPIIEVQADSIGGEENFGTGVSGYLKLKREGTTVGIFRSLYVTGWWKTEGNEH